MIPLEAVLSPTFHCDSVSVSVEVLVYCLFFLFARHVRATAWRTIPVVLVLPIAGKLLPNLILFCATYFFIGGWV